MSHKAKGSNAERELVHKFWNSQGWAACRIAGSGSMRYPSADVLAVGGLRRLAIEAKACKNDSQYFPSDEIDQLRAFSTLFNAEPWFAVRFDHAGWEFYMLRELEHTPTGFAARKGFGRPFDALLGG